MKKLRLEFGDIVWAKLNGEDHVQNGTRPSVIVQNNKGNHYGTTTQVSPLTSKLDKAKLPTHAVVPKSQLTGLKKTSIAQCEGARLVSQFDILGKIGKLNAEHMKEIAECWLVNNPLLIFFTGEELIQLQKRLIQSNKIYN